VEIEETFLKSIIIILAKTIVFTMVMVKPNNATYNKIIYQT